jgi:hypothetical protein
MLAVEFDDVHGDEGDVVPILLDRLAGAAADGLEVVREAGWPAPCFTSARCADQPTVVKRPAKPRLKVLAS